MTDTHDAEPDDGEAIADFESDLLDDADTDADAEASESSGNGDGDGDENPGTSASSDGSSDGDAGDYPLGYKMVCRCDGHGSGLVRGPSDGARASLDVKSHLERGHDAELKRVPVEARTAGGHVWDEVTD